ncbi:ClpXP protease specificity-enhancing factor [Pseudoalteromonas luteoviolacea]|uniref:ClpXP protease specificity-enhancing factor n=1 Tax=Pseudoalteromonas luteoviolacea TaxID=43657 RepID=UPI0007B0B96D|nr:ClpXP protease specificity-enhancing factor [Pseudoalteromonas luteoviolacea]MBQ4876848.1 ClpXP protease specificity-enhancing factor [Pseudoalteromonas luteoviolacea]MBQ4905363.1 ClpXP protease specificity-enhancing factor [Pseudoalteromonas luteoviolacea]
MTSNRPYLLRAFYEWIVDNQCTPHIVVNANFPHVQVPVQFVQDGQIVLNVSPSAANNFTMDNDALSFSARFSGQPMQVYVPVDAVLAIYARENGEGTIFSESTIEEDYEEESYDADDELAPEVEQQPDSAAEQTPSQEGKPKKGAHLRVIK